MRSEEPGLQITTLVENSRSPDDPQLVAEWGLSQCVEVGGRRLLFDTGASGAFARNATRLGVDVAAVDAAVLSHHHYDHGGGLRRFLELNDHAPIYLGAAPAGAPTARLFGVVRRYIGLDQALLARHAHRFHVLHERTEVLPGVLVLPRIVARHPRPSGNRILFVRTEHGLRPDDFRHEVVVALRERDTLAVLTGCSHNGLLNMVETVKTEFPGLPVAAVVGGFHLVGLPPFNGMSDAEPVVAGMGRQVLELGVGTTWTGHCTGTRAFEVLRGAMGERVQALHTGSRLEL